MACPGSRRSWELSWWLPHNKCNLWSPQRSENQTGRWSWGRSRRVRIELSLILLNWTVASVVHFFSSASGTREWWSPGSSGTTIFLTRASGSVDWKIKFLTDLRIQLWRRKKKDAFNFPFPDFVVEPLHHNEQSLKHFLSFPEEDISVSYILVSRWRFIFE